MLIIIWGGVPIYFIRAWSVVIFLYFLPPHWLQYARFDAFFHVSNLRIFLCAHFEWLCFLGTNMFFSRSASAQLVDVIAPSWITNGHSALKETWDCAAGVWIPSLPLPAVLSSHFPHLVAGWPSGSVGAVSRFKALALFRHRSLFEVTTPSTATHPRTVE